MASCQCHLKISSAISTDMMYLLSLIFLTELLIIKHDRLLKTVEKRRHQVFSDIAILVLVIY